jgi:hypothetical protein
MKGRRKLAPALSEPLVEHPRKLARVESEPLAIFV